MKKGKKKVNKYFKIAIILILISVIFSLSGCSNPSKQNNISGVNSELNLSNIKGRVNVYLFWHEGCPHCAAEKPYLNKLSEEYLIRVYLFEISDKKNLNLWNEFCGVYGAKPLGVPMTFIGEKHFVGFDSEEGSIAKGIESQIKKCIKEGCVDKAAVLKGEIEKANFDIYSHYSDNLNSSLLNNQNNQSNSSSDSSESCGGSKTICSTNNNKENNNSVNLTNTNLAGLTKVNKTNSKTSNNQSKNQKDNIIVPIIGKVDISKISLPLFTLLIAGLDGFNPCAMWVLSFLLTLLLYSKSRRKMLLVGLIFVITSGVIYFIFMTAWLNFFLIFGYIKLIRLIIGGIAILMGIINLKDSFWFKKGLSLTIPDKAKPKLFKSMRKIVKEAQKSDKKISLSLIIGTMALAVSANLIELACTAGFPAVYTRILTLKQLNVISYYAYLILYNAIYVIPLLAIVVVFSLTLGAHKFNEKSGRILKFIGGALMLFLGLILIYKPELLMFK